MRKTRTISIAALLAIVILSLFSFVACVDDVKELKVSSESVTVKAGQTVTVTATLDGASSFDWSSDNTEIATVDGGVITGVSRGKCNVTVKAAVDGQTYEKTIPVTVEAGDPVSYKTEYYVQQPDFSFTLEKSETTTAEFGSSVRITPEVRDGYVIDEAKSVLTGKVSADLVLKVYFAYESNRVALTKADGTTAQYYVYTSINKVLDSDNNEVTDFSVFALTPDAEDAFYFFDANGKVFRRAFTKEDFLSFDNQTMIIERASKDAEFNTVTNTQNVRARKSTYTVDLTDQWGTSTAAYIYRLESVSLSDMFYYSAKIRNFADGSDFDISAGFTFADVKNADNNAQFYIGGDGSRRILTQNNSYGWEAGQSTRQVTEDSFATTDGKENLLELYYSDSKFVFYLNGTYFATVNKNDITGRGNQAGLFADTNEMLIGLAQWRFNHTAQFSEVTLLTGDDAQAKFDAVSAKILADPELRAGDSVEPVIGTPYGNLTENIEWSTNDSAIAAFEDGKLVLKKCGDLVISASFEYNGTKINASGNFVVYDTPWADSRNAKRYADGRIETTASGWSGAYAYIAEGGADFYAEAYVSSADTTMSVGLTAKASNGASIQFYLTYWSVVLNSNHAWEAGQSTKTIYTVEAISELRLLKDGGVTVGLAHKDGVFHIYYEGFEICSITDEEAYGITAGDGFKVGVASWNNGTKAVFTDFECTFDSDEVQSEIDKHLESPSSAFAKYNDENGSIETSVDGWRGAFALLSGSGENFYMETTISSDDAATTAGLTVIGKDGASIQVYITYWNIVVNSGFKWAPGASTTVYTIAEGSMLFLTDGFKLALAHIDGVFHIYYQGFEVYSFADDSVAAYGIQAGDGFRAGVASWSNPEHKAIFTNYSVTFNADEIREKMGKSVAVSSAFHAVLNDDGSIETSIGGWCGAYAVLNGSGENFFMETVFTAPSEHESVGFTVVGGNGVSIQLYFAYNLVVLNCNYQWTDGASKTIYTGESGFNFVQANANVKIALAYSNGLFRLYYNGFELVSFTTTDAYEISSENGGFKAGVATWNNELNKVCFTDYSVTFNASEIESKMNGCEKISGVCRASYKDGAIEAISEGNWRAAYAVLEGSGSDFYIETKITTANLANSAGFTVVGSNGSIQLYFTYWSVVLNCNYLWQNDASKTIFTGADNVLLLKDGGITVALSCIDNVFHLYYEGTEIVSFSAADAYGITAGENGYKAGVASWHNTDAVVFTNYLTLFDKTEILTKTSSLGKLPSAVKAVKNADGTIATSNSGWGAAYYMTEGSGNEFVLESKVYPSNQAISSGFNVVGKDGASIQFYVSYWNVVVCSNYQWVDATTTTTVYTGQDGVFLLKAEGSVLRLEYKDGEFKFYCDGTLYATVTTAQAFGIQPADDGFRTGVASWFNNIEGVVYPTLFAETKCTFGTANE